MKRILAIIVAIMLVVPSFAFAANTDVDVMIPDYDIKVNGVKIDTEHSQYPALVYKGVTYFPMTSDYLAGIGLDLKFSNEEGIKIATKDTLNNLVQKFLGENNELGSMVKAQLPSFPIFVNGKIIDNASEQYPILSYKSVTYFPMTWRFAVTEFGWKTTWSNETGFGINIVKEPLVPVKEKLSTTEIGKLTDAVVQIEIKSTDNNIYTGSGFFYNNKGGIVTNIHVIANPKSITVIDDSGKRYTKDIMIKGMTFMMDLAILDTAIDNDTFLEISADPVSIGNDVYAIGSPLGYQNTLSEGIVSAVDYNRIQMTAAVSPGSSGGPLINEFGECIGVVSAKVQDGENIGFAIPSRMIMNVDQQFNFTVSEFSAYGKKVELYEVENGFYIGMMKKNKFEGYGEFVDTDGNVTIGTFDDHVLNGKGTVYFANGFVYNGTFEDDEATYGNLNYYSKKNFSTYKGSLSEWMYDGKGELSDEDGSHYKGEFTEGKKDGFGKLELENGDVYEGFFVEGIYHGQGEITYKKGGSYTGGWSDGLRSGYGTYTYSNGTVKSGNWENGELVE